MISQPRSARNVINGSCNACVAKQITHIYRVARLGEISDVTLQTNTKEKTKTTITRYGELSYLLDVHTLGVMKRNC